MLQRLPLMMGAEVVRYSVNSWALQGWRGPAFEPWAKRKNPKDQKRAILVKTGRLRRSIRVVRWTTDYVVIGTDVPYARVHNEGFAGTQRVNAYVRNQYKHEKVGTGIYSTKTHKERRRTMTSVAGTVVVKAHTRYMRIPRRHFLGDSPWLRKEIQKMIAVEIMRVANNI
jgi:phage gpG-like protein